MISYAVDIRAINDPALTPGTIQTIACEELKLCESVGCYRCGMGDNPAITCNQLESDEAGYELAVSASEGPQSWTNAPGWKLVSWRSPGALHFELQMDEVPDADLLRSFFARLHGYGLLHVTITNRASTPQEHPAAVMPRFRSREDD